MISELFNNYELAITGLWGPESQSRQQFKDIPLGFYNRFEKVGRCCDLNSVLNKKYEEDDEFIKIEGVTKKTQKSTTAMKPKVYVTKRNQQKSQQNNKHYSQKWTKHFVRAKISQKTKFKESVMIKNEWTQVKNIRPNFEKELTVPVTIDSFKQVGVIRLLNPEVQKVTRKEYKLDFKNDYDIKSNFTQDDPVLRNLMFEYYEKEELDSKVVILLPQFLTAIMTLKSGVFPWHIFISKKGNLMILNSFEDTPLTYLDIYTCNQNTHNNMPDEASVLDNCKMATQVSRSFKEQIASGDIAEQVQEQRKDDAEGNSAQSDGSFKKYIKISIGDTEFYTYAEVDGAKVSTHPYTGQETTKHYLTKALVETESNYQWKRKFQTTAGDVISGEYLANNVNWQRWLIEAEISDIEHFKAAYVSENNDGVFNILNVLQISKKEIRSNIGFNIKKCWSVLQHVTDQMFQEPDGNYIVMKSAYQNNLRVFQIPDQEDQEDNDA